MPDFSLKKALAAVKQRNAEAGEKPAEVRRIDPNTPQERITRARQQESALMVDLEWLQTQPDSDLKTIRLGAMFDRLGELAAEQGDYERAATISKTQERRDHYRMIVKAINRDNTKNCKCEPDLIVDRANGKEFQSPAIMTVETIIGPDGGTLRLDVCRKCGFGNAR